MTHKKKEEIYKYSTFFFFFFWLHLDFSSSDAEIKIFSAENFEQSLVVFFYFEVWNRSEYSFISSPTAKNFAFVIFFKTKFPVHSKSHVCTGKQLRILRRRRLLYCFCSLDALFL